MWMNDRPIFRRPHRTIHPSYTTFDDIVRGTRIPNSKNRKKLQKFGRGSSRKQETDNLCFGEINCELLRDLTTHHPRRRQRIAEPATSLNFRRTSDELRIRNSNSAFGTTRGYSPPIARTFRFLLRLRFRSAAIGVNEIGETTTYSGTVFRERERI